MGTVGVMVNQRSAAVGYWAASLLHRRLKPLCHGVLWGVLYGLCGWIGRCLEALRKSIAGSCIIPMFTVHQTCCLFSF
ncbi:hypothetical protein XFEB_00448 [Xylella fastidiosa EB92.1]|nr:hypothetical protein XFEB_00448 [Xylella fastidiosa EB92.1]